MNNLAWDTYSPFNVGLDDIFHRLESMSSTNTNYPPYNLVKVDSTTYEIEIALAGFSKNEIEVVLTDGVLEIKSVNAITDKDPNDGLVHKGIAKRAFTRKFTLADDIEVKDAKLENGLLVIDLEQIVPEHKKPKTIKVK